MVSSRLWWPPLFPSRRRRCDCEFRQENGWKLKYQDAYDVLTMMSNAANAH